MKLTCQTNVFLFLTSLNGFDLPRPPGFVEEGFQRAVETKYREPTLAGQGLDPVVPLDPLG